MDDNAEDGTPAEPEPGYRPLRQLCPMCTGKGTLLTPRFGLSSDGTSGTVHVEERCRDCVDGWIAWGSTRAS